MDNYFNYFTEIEECFRRCRGTPTLLSTLDWALVESWKEAGIPLEAVLTGIERAFQKFSKRPQRFRKINGLAYCSQAVLQAAAELNTAQVESGAPAAHRPPEKAPFAAEEILAHLNQSAEALEKASAHCHAKRARVLAEDLQEVAKAICEIALRGEFSTDLEDLEQRLSALEEKLTAALTRAASTDLLTEVRKEVDRGLVSYRQKMTAPQIESLGRQFLKKRLYEHYAVPRLSLFYL
ncbi:MAG TPA: hypothetical protein VG028_08700 [Terriglobia bacterium]|nr:hypothetical protein [Terriglobia bacterium]